MCVELLARTVNGPVTVGGLIYVVVGEQYLEGVARNVTTIDRRVIGVSQGMNCVEFAIITDRPHNGCTGG